MAEAAGKKKLRQFRIVMKYSWELILLSIPQFVHLLFMKHFDGFTSGSIV